MTNLEWELYEDTGRDFEEEAIDEENERREREETPAWTESYLRALGMSMRDFL